MGCSGAAAIVGKSWPQACQWCNRQRTMMQSDSSEDKADSLWNHRAIGCLPPPVTECDPINPTLHWGRLAQRHDSMLQSAACPGFWVISYWAWCSKMQNTLTLIYFAAPQAEAGKTRRSHTRNEAVNIVGHYQTLHLKCYEICLNIVLYRFGFIVVVCNERHILIHIQFPCSYYATKA